MSTRAQIGIYPTTEAKLSEYEILIYNHSDGYPEGMLPILEPFLKEFQKKQGLTDTEYVGAWLLYDLMSNKKASGFVGFGICGDKQLHGDIEYFYAVYPDRLEVYALSDLDSAANMDMWEAEKIIPL